MDDILANIPEMDDILPKLKRLIDDLSIAQQKDRDMKMSIMLSIRIFNIGEAYEKLEECLKTLKTEP